MIDNPEKGISPGDRPATSDWRGLGDLLALGVRQLANPVEGMHHAIADRWFWFAGPKVAPVRDAYRSFTAAMYGSVRVTGSVLGTATGLGAYGYGRRRPVRPLWRSPVGSKIQATANAVWGDELARVGSPLSIELGLRDPHGEPIDPRPAGLDAAFPTPTSRLVVLVPGLAETERCWQKPSKDGTKGAGLPDVLAADAFTPLRVRYNTGRHVSENGFDLAALVEEVVEGWPVPIEEIVLIGNSMGGLVARSALHAGRAAGHRWIDSTRHLVTVGTPHLGAPLEKGAHLASWALRFVPESRPIGEFIDTRSSGIKDLRFGAIVDEDWRWDEAGPVLRDGVTDLPPLDGVHHHFVAGVITADPAHPVGVLVGDLIVRAGSGTGRGRRRTVEATNVHVLGGRRHFDLLHDPDVHDTVRAWLTRAIPPV